MFSRAAEFLLRLGKKTKRTEQAGAFEINRLAQTLKVLAVGAILTLAAWLAGIFQDGTMKGYSLKRPEKGQGSSTLELRVDAGRELQTEQMEIVLKEREYTQEEKQEFLDEAAESLPRAILGENASPDEVSGKLELPNKLADGNVDVQWSVTPYGILDTEGNITADIPEEGELLTLRADLSCDGASGYYECALRLVPPAYTAKEKLLREVQKKVEEEDDKSAQNEVMELPREAGGETLIWSEKTDSMAGICMALSIAAAFAVWTGADRKRKNEKERRSRQMLLDYPALLFQLSMLLNAGMTMQNAFVRMALDYRNRKDKSVRYAYEEMLTAYYEMQSGVPEARAYENFGKRCGESVYIKLGSMLSGNLQKGSQGLAKILQEEADFSMEERKQLAKKLGEEAGTKLLLPMMLMLLVVLVILMVPALLAF